MSLRHSNHAIAGELIARGRTPRRRIRPAILSGDERRRLFRASLRDPHRCNESIRLIDNVQRQLLIPDEFLIAKKRRLRWRVPEGPPKIARQFHWRERATTKKAPLARAGPLTLLATDH